MLEAVPPPSSSAAPSVPEPPSVTAEIRSRFAAAKHNEQRLSRLLIAFITSGLVFLLGPGSFLGLWNLFAISREQSAAGAPLGWLQAHGHAEVYGWVGSFILGIGFHSLTRVRQARTPIGWAWCCWGLWTAGVATAWWAGVYAWHWRILLPLGTGLELAGFLIFLVVIFRALLGGGEPTPGWVVLVLTGTLGLLLTLLLNFGGALVLAARLGAPVLPMNVDWEMVDLLVWVFLTPFVLGFSTRWFPVFAGFRPAKSWMPASVSTAVALGAMATLLGMVGPAAICWLAVAVEAVMGLHVFGKPAQPAKISGIHGSFRTFLRFAYGWLLVSALLGVAAAWAPLQAMIGLSGASRHALTVGFIAGMILCIAPRILPAFSGRVQLYSPRLMFYSLLLLETGCVLRVVGEALAYPGWLPLAWQWLPFSAGLEITAFVVFAYNIARTLLRRPGLQPAPQAA